MPQHTPVLLEEVLGFLNPQPGGRFIDATLGAGGHAAAIQERTAPDGRLLGIDQDAAALELARETLAPWTDRTVIIRTNFSEVAQAARAEGFLGVDGVIADLGVSSMMLDEADRGFSFRTDGPLDMRMDRRQLTSAAELVNTGTERQLADTIYRLGEERRLTAHCPLDLPEPPTPDDRRPRSSDRGCCRQTALRTHSSCHTNLHGSADSGQPGIGETGSFPG